MRTVSEFDSLAVFELKGGFIMERMVMVKNMIESQLSIPFGMVKYRWLKRGQVVPMPFEALQQLLWNEGVKVMFTSGMLYIDSMEDKKALGLESADATQPELLIALNEQQIEEMLKTLPIDVFKKKLSTLPDAQIDNLIDYAIEKNIIDYNKCAILKEITGRDIMAGIQRKADIEAEEKREKEKRTSEGRRI